MIPSGVAAEFSCHASPMVAELRARLDDAQDAFAFELPVVGELALRVCVGDALLSVVEIGAFAGQGLVIYRVRCVP